MKLLLVQVSFLGDVVLATPVIGALKERYPDAELWMMTTPLAEELVKRDPRLAGTIPFDKRGKHKGILGTYRFIRELRACGFDAVYSLHRSFRTSLVLFLSSIRKRIGFQESRCSFLYTERRERRKNVHDVLRNLSLLDDSYDEESAPPMKLHSPESEEISSAVQDVINAGSPYIAFVPGSAWATKRWYWERYRELGQKLTEQGERVFVLGAPNESEICTLVSQDTEMVNLCGKTTVGELLALVEHARYLVCNDSMALHLASAFHTPTIAVFCATSPSFGFGPWRNKFEIVEKSDLHCKPCRRHGSQVCPTGTQSCMQDVSAEDVHQAIERVMAT